MVEHHLRTWGEFKDFIANDIVPGDRISRGSFLFRGQGNASWPLRSSFDRAFSHISNQHRDQLEKSLLEIFKREFETDIHHKELMKTGSEQEILAFAQHYGLPTRLLDWSESPYTAAFFAFNNRLESLIYGNSLSDDVAIWVLKVNHYIWRANRGASVFRPKSWDNIRLFRQSGWFTYTQTPTGDLALFPDDFPDAEDALFKLIIDKEAAQDAFADLDLMGVNPAMLFDDTSARARAAIIKTILTFKES